MHRIKQTLARLGGSSRSSKHSTGDSHGLSSEKTSFIAARTVSTTSTAHTSTSGNSGESTATLLSDLHLDESDKNRGLCFLHGHELGGEGADVVLVHGLQGHRTGTWAKGDVCWPRDFLGSDMPEARVISWGYSVGVSQCDDHDNLSSLGDQLLDDLVRFRVKYGGGTRPIVFVGHGHGGIVIKEAIATAAIARIYGNGAAEVKGEVYAQTKGVIFLGTTHVAAPGKTLGETIALHSRITPRPVDSRLVEFSATLTEVFEKASADFALFSRDMQVVCIREDKPTPSGLMVSKDTAFYEGGPNVTMDSVLADHFGIARFEKRTDPGYFQLLGHLSKLTQEDALSDFTEAKEQRSREILDMLYFDSMFDRAGQIKIEDEYRPACSQILAQKSNQEPESSFHRWLRSNEPLFWVSGKAGAAKSTLMKYAFHDEETKRRLERWASGKLLMANVFLFGEGSQLQRGHGAILRTILFQVLSERRDLIPVAFPTFYGGPWPPLVPLNTVTNLTQAGYALISQQASLVIFVDGLDDYRCHRTREHEESSSESASEQTGGEEERGGSESDHKEESSVRKRWLSESHQEIAALMTSMSANPRFKLCVASRELPVFERAFGDCPRLRMHTQSDKSIAKYCEARLAESAPGIDLSDLCLDVASKAGGDMIWARLAIDLLLEQSLKMLRPTLVRLPTKLGGCRGLYMHILKGLPADRQQDAARMFQLMHRTQKIQSPSALMLALARGGYLDSQGQLLIERDRTEPKTLDQVKEGCEEILNRLRECCPSLFICEGQLLEPNQRILFAHPSVRLFAARSDVWERLLGGARGYIGADGPIDTDMSLMSGCIRQVQYFRPGALRPFLQVHGISRVQIVPEAWLAIATALRYAARIDAELCPDDHIRRSHYLALLDHLDNSCWQVWVDSLHNYRPLLQDADWFESQIPTLSTKHWAGFEPMETGKPPKRKCFLALAIQANLATYVAASVERLRESGAPDLSKTFERLLEAAVSTTAEVGEPACRALAGDYRGFHSNLPSTPLVKTILRAGREHIDLRAGAPNKVWARALQTRHRFFSPQHRSRQAGVSRLLADGDPVTLALNQERWVTAVRWLLVAGADPLAVVPPVVCSKAKRGNGVKDKSEGKSAADIIRETLTVEPRFAEDLNEITSLIKRQV